MAETYDHMLEKTLIYAVTDPLDTTRKHAKCGLYISSYSTEHY